MKIWVVRVGDCEGSYTVCLCSSKEIAERELFKKRDDLVKEWNESLEYFKKEGHTEKMYEDMIANLSSNNYQEWENYPHDVPSIYEMEVIEE